ncbi:MAG: DPP IV N-terminal domain-containing protein [Leadbetterella sp.]
MKIVFKLLLLIFVSTRISAQQKDTIPDELLITGKSPGSFLQSLPSVNEWLSPHTIQVFMKPSENESPKKLILNLKTNQFETDEAGNYKVNTPSRKKLYIKNGDIYLKTNDDEERLTDDSQELERNPTFSPDSQYVAFTKNNNLYTYHIETKRLIQLTTDGSKTILNGFSTWLYWEEIFGRSTNFRAFWWSPDSKKIAFMRFNESSTPMFPIYNSDGKHGYIEETRYPKSGDPNPTVKLAISDVSGDNVSWVSFPDPEEFYLGWPKWTLNSDGLMVQYINRDNKHLKLYNVSAKTGTPKLLYEEKQDTWINIDQADERLTLLPGGKEMIILSDKSGWNHLYLYGIDGKIKNQITSGTYTVKEVIGIDNKARVLYFQALKENSARFDLYKISLDGKNLQRLSFGSYNFRRVEPSPDFSYFVLTYSNTKNPASMCVIDNKGTLIRELGSTKGTLFDQYQIHTPSLYRVKSTDGKFDLPMTVIYPKNFDPDKKYPVLISVYGGPDAARVFDQWAWSPRTEWLANEGLIQVAMDHRASGHFGKEGINYLHKNLGHWELIDYTTMVEALINNGGVDTSKIAITGFSYGGYITCLALTKAAKTFTHGMAGGSVTSWELYDSAYTERFMDTPNNNSEGYKSSSVLTYIDNFKGKLLLVHGANDDNVHMQNSIQLIDALQERKKEFEMMIYPNAKHGWGGEKGIHFDNLKLKFIYQHLLQKPVPEGLLKF